jgi:signal transduction histidine kinase
VTIRRHLTALASSLADAALALAAAVSLALHILLFGPGWGLSLLGGLPTVWLWLRRLPQYARRRFGVDEAYQPMPDPPALDSTGYYVYERNLYKHAYWPKLWIRIQWILGDRAFGRDLLWLLVTTVLGFPLAVAPFALAVAAVFAVGWWGLLALPVTVFLVPYTTKAYASLSKRYLSPPPAIGRARIWWGVHFFAMVKVIALVALSLVSLVFLAVSVVALAVFCLGGVVVLPPFVERVRWLANARRRLAARWSDVVIEQPYRPRPGLPVRRPDGLYAVGKNLYKTPKWTRYNQRLNWVWHDPATWRDLLWVEADAVVGLFLVAVPLAAFVGGIWFVALPALWHLIGIAEAPHWTFVAEYPWLSLVGGLIAGFAGLSLAPAAVRINSLWTRLLLAPTAKARLTSRVQQLTEVRSDLTESQAAELRRIERDLHDGAQARLVAIGLALGTVDALLETDPPQARRVLAEAREASSLALAELRSLVRGIHPPVLAERGLGDAVRALVLNSGMTAKVTVQVDGRPEQPVEAAMYFAVSELLTNAAKHSGARTITVDLVHDGYNLIAVVADDGRGGVEVKPEGGLRGVARRLEAFDGTVAVDSPPGGPTKVVLEVPCALSSPRTSTSSATG